MNSGTIITDAGAYDQGPSAFLARIGNPSPSSPAQVQYANSSGTNWFDTLKQATKNAVTAVIGPGTATVSIVSKAAEGIGAGAKAAGEGIGKAASSATSGIKWGVAIVIVLGLLFILAPYVGLLPRRN